MNIARRNKLLTTATMIVPAIILLVVESISWGQVFSPPNLTREPADEHKNSTDRVGDSAEGFLNLPMPTTGGQQFWTDFVCRGDWRIQQNSETGHFRLLDNHEVRQAWGNFKHCQEILKQKEAAGELKPETGRVVVLLHGLIRTSASMDALEEYFSKRGYGTVNFRYSSSRKLVDDHASALHSVIENLDPQVTDIYIVAHSLGNLVVRRYLAAQTNTDTGAQGDPRLRRMVMLGPPNQGSKVARLFKRSLLFNTIAGKSGGQLAARWEELEPTLATPAIEFGIIAGGQNDEREWNNFLLEGKDDFTVSVEETKLEGAKDFIVRPLLHSNMMKQPEVLEMTERFFEKGRFAESKW